MENGAGGAAETTMRIETRSAASLREALRKLPKTQRDANQGFSIRVWRAISWLERAESFDASDPEGRFISTWIGFNALYGRLDDGGKPWGDRESWGAFLAQVSRLDHESRIRRILGKRENQTVLSSNKLSRSAPCCDSRRQQVVVLKGIRSDCPLSQPML